MLSPPRRRRGTVERFRGGAAISTIATAAPPRASSRFRPAGILAALGLALALVACQSTEDDVLGSAAGPRQAQETVGSAEAEAAIALLLPRSAGGEAGRRARDIRDGAALALDDLGDGRLALAIHDTGRGAGRIAALAAETQAAGARLILGPATPDAAAALVQADAARRPPAIAFTGNGDPHGSGVFAIVSDAVDSALESARIVAGAGRRTFAAVVPEGFSEADRTRLRRGVEEAGGRLAGFVGYPGAGSGIAARIAAGRETLVGADAVVVFGDGDAPAAVAATMRAASALQPNATLIGNLAWAQANFARPELEGALVAMPDQSGLAVIADRYRERTGRTLSIEAAYGYDAVAVAAGIVRAMGADALAPATLTRASGFRGATGVFRFLPDGQVHRLLALYQVRGGALQLLDPPPVGF